MSPNARWRCSKIVESQIPNKENNEEELTSGLKNALERGETLEKAKQSFINAGYKSEKIEAASQKMPATTPKVTKPLASPIKTTIPAKSKTTTTSKLAPTTPVQQKKLSKKLIITLTSIVAFIFITAAILGILWNKIF